MSDVTLTVEEARVLHEALRNAWAPSKGYTDFISGVRKLDAIAHSGGKAPPATKDGGHRGSQHRA